MQQTQQELRFVNKFNRKTKKPSTCQSASRWLPVCEQIHRFSSSKKSNLCDKPVLLELQQTLAGTIFSCRLLHIRCSGVSSSSSRTVYVGSSQNKNYSEAHWCFWSSTTQRKWIHQGWNCRLFNHNNNPVNFHRLLLKIGNRKRKKSALSRLIGQSMMKCYKNASCSQK